MGDSESPDDPGPASPKPADVKSEKKEVPGAIPFIQGLCVVALVVIFLIDANFPEVSPPTALYVTIGGIALGLDPKALLDGWKGR